MRKFLLRRATEDGTHMAASSTDSNSDTRVRPDRGSPPSTPRWVKVFGIIVLVLVLLFVILHLTGISNHGPGSHMRSDGGHTSPSSVIAYGGQQL